MQNAFETDVLIVGGGPAGTSTALSLLKYANVKVVILEQGDLNNLRVGEQVNASIFDLLTYLGIDKNDLENNSFLPGHDSLAAWGSPNISSRHSIFSTQVDSYQLDREKFDLCLLAKAAERGAIILPRTKALEFIQDGIYWRVGIRNETKGAYSIKAKYLVDATGRQSHVCRKLGAGFTKLDDLVAVGLFLHLKNEQQTAQEILLETVEEGWWYFAALPGDKMVVSLFTDSAIAKEKQLHKVQNWVKSVLKTEHIKKKMSAAVGNDKLWTRNAFSHLTDTSGITNFLAVGDAAASFDPISSMGIGFGVSSACYAAKAILDHEYNPASLSEYNKSIANIFDRYLETRHSFYQKEQRWNDSPFWRTRNVS
jgi:flavin-dependent dehydrogenase